MKKLRLLLCISLLVSSVTYANIEATLESINNEMQALEIKEKQKFKLEEEKAKQSEIKYTTFVAESEIVNTKILELESSLEQSFYPEEQKSLLNSYKSISKELKEAISIEGQKIQEFNQLKQILGY
jgi:hypothetical protein